MAANGNNTNSGDEVYTSMYQVDEENTVSLNHLNNKIKTFVKNNNIIIEGYDNLKKISISDINGQTVYNDTYVSLPTKISTSILNSGIYVISHVDKNNIRYNKKISIK